MSYQAKFKNHVCKREDHCDICISFVNKHSIWKNILSNNNKSRTMKQGVHFQNIISVRGKKPQTEMGNKVTSSNFMLPKPVLVRP